jgi:putative addiction module killer protein
MNAYEIENYRTEAGTAPFQTWFENLKDSKAKTIIVSRLERASNGFFGDWKPVIGAGGLREMRVHYGQGYRLFYTIVGQRIVLLVAGSTKHGQDKTIVRATEYLVDYQRRTRS